MTDEQALRRAICGDPADKALALREKELLQAHRTDWLQALPEWAHDFAEFRRGFVSRVRFSAADFLQEIARLQKVVPLEGVHLGGCVGHMDEVANCPHLARLTFLDLAINKIGNDGATALAGAPHLANLTHLARDSTGIGEATWRALPPLPWGGNSLGPRGAAALAACTRLTYLDL
jgi:hypothetical protein